MNRVYQRLLLLIAFVVLISAAVIYFTVDINTLTNITEFQPWSVALAITVMGVGLYLDALRLVHLVRISREDIRFYDAMKVVFGNYFLALLTPGATGGAVAQMMFLCRNDIPAGKATVIILAKTIMSILFLLLLMPVIFLHSLDILPGISNHFLMACSVVIFVLLVGLAWLVRRGFLDRIARVIAGYLSQRWQQRFIHIVQDTKQAVNLLSTEPKRMTVVFLESGISLMAIFAVVPCLFLGLGIFDADWYVVMARMIFLNTLLYFMPTPGGSGIAEGGFVLLFGGMVPAGTVGILAVGWRIIAEYLPFLIGFYYTLAVFGRDFLVRPTSDENS